MSGTAEPHLLPNGGALHPKAYRSDASTPTPKPALDIIDIRRAAVEINLKEEILSMFHPKHGPRQLPTLLLYDESGLQLFEEITYLDEYYLTNYEIEVLKASAGAIAENIANGSMVIELGSGNLRKVNLLLQALEAAGKKIDYYALDLSQRELERTLAQLPDYKHVSFHGLLGTYEDGREWLKLPSKLERRKCILSLGSSIGNFHRDEAAKFLKEFADVLRPGRDLMLVGVDGCENPSKVYHAYNDHRGLTHEFVLNGLHHANKLLGMEAFKVEDWHVIGEYVCDAEGGRHQAFYSPIQDTVVLGELIKTHERIQVEQSLKYSPAETVRLWGLAGLAEIGQWKHANEYGLHLLARPQMPFSLIPAVYANAALPSLEDWKGVWAAWDAVTRDMLPNEELLEKPIKLRNACIFYLGHIPTFLDIQLTKTTHEAATEPADYHSIFERGIDPDVDNPELCHDHSEIPDEWPPLLEILAYQGRVRDRVAALYAAGFAGRSRNVARALWLGFEHELMHLETLLYMLLQSNKTLPPPHAQAPNFAKVAANARLAQVPNQWFDIAAREVTVGLDDPEESEVHGGHFGWDNEKPSRSVKVKAFQAKGRPITNEEYAQYMLGSNMATMPASWARLETVKAGSNGTTRGHVNGTTRGHVNGNGIGGHSNGHTNGDSNGTGELPKSFLEGKAVRTVYGLVPLKYALDWPIFASYDELAGCALWMGGRIPTAEEAQSIYAQVNIQKKGEAERKLGKTVPAVNGHLSNNGVEISPPSRASKQVGGEPSSQEDLFIDLDGANVGFQHWHPVPVTAKGDQLAGQSELGGVWEWTSTTLRKHEGFQPMALYPGYTADFFDEKHNVVLGGSWATHPRIAGRKSFVNWYQRNYLYAWTGARLVRDAP